MSARKALVFVTLAFAVVIVVAVLLCHRKHLPEAITINTKNQPTIGYSKAKVQLVVFEEPKCINCKEFNDELFPKIKEEFIDTNKIRYTVIPVSFLPGSMPAAIALLCVYHNNGAYPNDELFFTYLQYMFDHQPGEHADWATRETLMEYAKQASPAINIQKLKSCTEKQTYRDEIERNNEYGKKVMGGILSTPTLFVDGIEVKELSYKKIKKLTEDVLERKGVH